MLIYTYKAYDYKGRLQTGRLFVGSEEEAISFLLKNNLTPIEVKLLPQTLITNFFFRLFFKISFNQKIYLLRSLYLILKSGLSLDKGLQILIRESKGSLKDFLLYLSYNLQKGEPFYKAFASFSDYFSSVEIETIKAGEISGNLVKNLEKLINNLEKEREIRNEIISNSLYPLIVFILIFVVLFILIFFVVPKISLLLTELSSKPPFFTQLLINISSFLNKNLTLFIYSFILIILTLIFIFSLKRTRNFFIKIITKLPLISSIYDALALSQAFFILKSLLGVGISLPNAFILTANSLFHNEFKQCFYNIEKQLKAGKKVGDAFLSQERMPTFVSSILGIAAESGFLEETLSVLENYYMEEFRVKVKNFLNLLQPLLLIFVGIIVGFVAVAVLVPIYQQISTQLQFQGQGGLPGSIR